MSRTTTVAGIAAITLGTTIFLAPGALAGKPPPPPSVPTVQFQKASYNYSESSSYAQIQLVRTGSTTAPSTVAFSTVDGTAHAPGDYTDATGNVTFPVGYTGVIVQVPIVDDSLKESTETVNLRLASVTGGNAQIGKTNKSTLNIADNDPCNAVSVNNAGAPEGDAMTFTVSMSAACSAPVQVSWHTTTTSTGGGVDATPTADFDNTQHGNVAIPSGSTSATFSVTSAEDGTDEPDQTFAVVIDHPVNTNVATGTGTATIQDDDSAPSVVLSDNPTATEGSDLVYTISLGAASEKIASGTIGTWAGNAADARYTAVPSTAWSIPAGSTSTTFTVPTSDDGIYQGADTAVWAHLLTATNATIPSFICDLSYPDYSCGTLNVDDAWSYGLLQDNESQPSLSVDDPATVDNEWTIYTCAYSAYDGVDCNLTFTVTLSGPSASNVTVAYGTSDGTADSGDYGTTSGTLTFLPGETSQTVNVQLYDNSVYVCESPETVNLTLSLPSGATISDDTGVGTIYDSDC